MFKKIVCAIAALLLSIIPVFATEAETNQPNITSLSYVLYNPDNDEIVEGNNYNQRMFPASLTKMLTAVTVMNICDDVSTEKVTVSQSAISLLAGTNSSKAGLRVNEVFTVEELLYLMLLPSGNDAANVLAEHFNTETTSFVDHMNRVAKEIGMKDSHFVNPHGLHDDNHYSTAADLAFLADAYMDIALLCEIAKADEFRLPVTNEHSEYWVRCTNFMNVKNSGYYYEYSTGLKTGYTDKAGRCLAASAEKNGERYICILLFTPEVWDKNGLVRTEFLEATEIFEYAFETYDCVKIASKNQIVTELPVYETYGKKVKLVFENDIYATVKKGTDIDKLEIEFKPKNLIDCGMIDSPVNVGESFGNASLMLYDKEIGFCNVVASKTVEPNGFLVFWHKIDLFVYIFLGVISFIILLFVFFIIRKKVVIYKRKKNKEARIARRKRQMLEFEEKEPYNYFKMD